MFYDKFEALCRARGESPSSAAINMGLNKSTVSRWKRYGSAPHYSVLKLISEYFGVSIDSLLETDRPEEMILSADESYLLETYRELPEASKQLIIQVLEMAKTSALGKNNLDSSVEAV